MFEAARDTGMQVIWDFWHYGWPDDLDIFSAAFITRFTRFAREAAAHLSDYAEAPFVCPINEISFFSWAGGEGGIFNPFAKHRGNDLKRQLVSASIEAIHAMREVNPAIRFFHIDPIINVLPASPAPEDVRHAEEYRQSQFQACDMLLGRAQPELGGGEELIDIIGVNYYIHNQFVWEELDDRPLGPALSSRRRDAAGDVRAISSAALRGRDRHRGHHAPGLAPLHVPGGADGARSRRASQGDLPLPNRQPCRMGRRSALSQRDVRLRGRRREPAGVSEPGRRGRTPARQLRADQSPARLASPISAIWIPRPWIGRRT